MPLVRIDLQAARPRRSARSTQRRPSRSRAKRRHGRRTSRSRYPGMSAEPVLRQGHRAVPRAAERAVEIEDFRMRLLVLEITLVLASGCSSDAMQRPAYEAVQGAGRRDCRQYPAVECPRRESYDDYQKQRKELEK